MKIILSITVIMKTTLDYVDLQIYFKAKDVIVLYQRSFRHVCNWKPLSFDIIHTMECLPVSRASNVSYKSKLLNQGEYKILIGIGMNVLLSNAAVGDGEDHAH